MLIFVGPDFGTLSCVSYQRPRENSNIQDSSCASAQAALSLPIVGSLNSQYSHDTVGATSTVGRPARENDDDEEELEDIPVAPAVMHLGCSQTCFGRVAKLSLLCKPSS